MDIFDIALAKQLAGGGGQPLYRHRIRIECTHEDGNTAFVSLDFISANPDEYNYDTLCEEIGDGEYLSVCGDFSSEDYASPILRILSYGSELYHCPLIPNVGLGEFTLEKQRTTLTDTVTEIGTASVSGGGDCQIVEIPSQGHAEAQTTILDLLKPDSVPTGKYLYSYYTDGCERNNATIAICYKNSEKITGTQLTSDGDVRKFWYYFESEEEGNECFQPLGGHRLYRHSLTIDYSANDCEGLICLDFISTCENKFDYATLRNHISTDQMASGFHKDANGVCYPIVKLYKDLYDIYVCPLYSNSLGENTVSESMIGEIYDKITPVDEYRLM